MARCRATMHRQNHGLGIAQIVNVTSSMETIDSSYSGTIWLLSRAAFSRPSRSSSLVWFHAPLYRSTKRRLLQPAVTATTKRNPPPRAWNSFVDPSLATEHTIVEFSSGPLPQPTSLLASTSLPHYLRDYFCALPGVAANSFLLLLCLHDSLVTSCIVLVHGFL